MKPLTVEFDLVSLNIADENTRTHNMEEPSIAV